MLDKPNRTTLSGITPRQRLRLQEIALEIVGETNISALLRYIAERGILVREPTQTRLRVAGVITDRLVVEAPKKEGEPDAQ